MHSGNKKEYKIEDLPKFFKGISKNTGEVFSDEAFKISTIRSRSIDNGQQAFSFKLKLLDNKKSQDDSVRKIDFVINFFNICLDEGKGFAFRVGVSQEDEELSTKNPGLTLPEFIKLHMPVEAIARGITIELKTNVGDIRLNNLNDMVSFLDEKLAQAAKTNNRACIPPQVNVGNVGNVQRSIDAIVSHTEYFEARKEASEAKVVQIPESLKTTIMQAQNEAMIALLDVDFSPQKGRLDAIFIEIVSMYEEQDEKTFNSIFDAVFDTVYCANKPLQVDIKKGQLRNLIRPVQPEPVIQSEPDHLLKSPLRNIFSSKDTYFYLCTIVTSTSALCLLHFTALGKSVITEESVGLILNVALLILISMCTISLAYVAYSEYTVESIEKVDTGNLQKVG